MEVFSIGMEVRNEKSCSTLATLLHLTLLVMFNTYTINTTNFFFKKISLLTSWKRFIDVMVQENNSNLEANW
jgi:hypothetical protein